MPNPERKAGRKQLADAHTVLKTLDQQYGQRAGTNHEGQRPTMRGFKIANADLSRDMRAQVAQCQALRARLAGLPERVAVKSLLDAAEIVKLAPEAKHLTDTIKMLAYRAETFEEQVDLMLKCFNEESFSHHGKAYDVPPPVEYRGYQLRDITCVPPT